MNKTLGMAVAGTLVLATGAAHAQTSSFHSLTVRKHGAITNSRFDHNDAKNRMSAMTTINTTDSDGSGTQDVECVVGYGLQNNALGANFGGTSTSSSYYNVNTNAAISNLLNSFNGYVKVVNTLGYCGSMGSFRGCANTNSMVVTRTAPSDTWLHEFGHTVGRGHYTGSNNLRVMKSGTSNRQHVTQSDCNAFDNYVDLDGPGGSSATGDAVDPGVVAAVEAEDYTGIPIEEVARYNFIDTMPVGVVDYYGPSDVAKLRKMFRDPAEADHRDNIAVLIGLLSDGKKGDVDELMSSLKDSTTPDHVLLAAVVGLGEIVANTDSDDAFHALEETIEDGNSRGSKFAPTGLALTGKARAIGLLQKHIDQAGEEGEPVAQGKFGKQALREAIKAAREVGKKGLKGYLKH